MKHLLTNTSHRLTKATKGKVYLVGAGPGHEGLLTVRGAQLLRGAEVIIYDHLVNADLLQLARADAEKIYAGKQPYDTPQQKAHQSEQKTIHATMIARALSGKTVIRLKGGDPFVFGRGGEEVEALRDAGIDFEIVPGVSAAIAVPAFAGIPVTHREAASAFCVVTGHEDPTKPEPSVNWQAVAQFSGTRIILMGIKRLAAIAETLIKHGCAPQTPVAVIQSGSTAHQRTVVSVLSTIAADVQAAPLQAPSVIVVGEVVRYREFLQWFEQKPLFGKRIAVVRTSKRPSAVAQRLREEGANVWELPTVEQLPPRDKKPLIKAVNEILTYNWIIFTSPHAASHFFEEFFQQHSDIRALGRARFVAPGPGTAHQLEKLHLSVDLRLDDSGPESVAAALASVDGIKEQRVLIVSDENSTASCKNELQRLGANVTEVASYRSELIRTDPSAALKKLADEGADAVVFASSASVETFVRRVNLAAFLSKHPQTLFACIGPRTKEAAEQHGLTFSVESEDASLNGLAAALRAAFLDASTQQRHAIEEIYVPKQ